MNDFGMLKDVLDSISKSNDNLIVLGGTLLGFILVNIITAGVNIFYQFRLKEKEKDVLKFEILEQNRIRHKEELYNLVQDLMYYNNYSDLQLYLTKSSDLRMYLQRYKLYFNKELVELVEDFNDNYFITVLGQISNKNYIKENEYLNKLIDEFNR
ncbi:hypothetical protein [Empedobacter sp. GD03865]|uniref:hypothetical protein n=1 Tax=Empedobacter sp. GD03865 TaxID=2975392 RepID=UPI00244BC230|nr:hypothetical protein [Empedobacter sp. GD03865]MDH0660727.1 hypothetical protein [Empedobacter sp. GD03865]